MKKSTNNKRSKRPRFTAYYRFCFLETDGEQSLPLMAHTGNNKILEAIFSSDERYIETHYLTADPETTLGFRIGSSRSEDKEVVSFDLNQCYGFGYGMTIVNLNEGKYEIDNCCYLIFIHLDDPDIHVLTINNGADFAADLAFSFRKGCFRHEINQFLGNGNGLVEAMDEFQRLQ